MRVVHAAADHQRRDHGTRGDDRQPDREPLAAGGDLESHRMGGEQIHHQRRAEQHCRRGNRSRRARFQFAPLANICTSRSKPWNSMWANQTRKYEWFDDVPDAVIDLRERAGEDEKDRQREQHHRQPQRRQRREHLGERETRRRRATMRRPTRHGIAFGPQGVTRCHRLLRRRR